MIEGNNARVGNRLFSYRGRDFIKQDRSADSTFLQFQRSACNICFVFFLTGSIAPVGSMPASTLTESSGDVIASRTNFSTSDHRRACGGGARGRARGGGRDGRSASQRHALPAEAVDHHEDTVSFSDGPSCVTWPARTAAAPTSTCRQRRGRGRVPRALCDAERQLQPDEAFGTTSRCTWSRPGAGGGRS